MIAPTEPINAGDDFSSFMVAIGLREYFGLAYLNSPEDWTKYTFALLGDPTLKIKSPLFYHTLEVNEYTYTDEINNFKVNIHTNNEDIIEIKPATAQVDIYLNDQFLESYNLEIPQRGIILETKFTPQFGFNTFEVCLSSKIFGEYNYCINAGTYGVSSPIIIEGDNFILDCQKQKLNPRISDGVGVGITVESKNNITIQNCNISDFFRNIQLINSTNITIIDNYLSRIKTQSMAIYLNEEDELNPNKNIFIINNTFNNINFGIMANDLGDSLIQQNNFEGISSQLIVVSGGTNNIIKNNFLCADTGVGSQIICYGNPININESTGNNLDSAYCGPDWPIYGEHYLYCNETYTKSETIKEFKK